MRNKNLLFFISLSIVASFLNYATYPALSRILPESQFVNMTVALSLLTQMSTLLSSIVAVSTSLTKENTEDSHKQIELLQTVIIYLLLIVMSGFLVLSPILLPLIKLSYIYLIPICLMLLLSVPISVTSGYLNGKKLLIKLGVAVSVSALLQFSLSLVIGKITNNGALALIAMAGGQLLSVLMIYYFYKNDHLPHVKKILEHKKSDFLSVKMKNIIKYTVLSSLGVMIINILQIIDLLAVQNRQIDSRTYTDLYIVSRAVFFAGTIFVWPFISATELKNGKNNLKQFKKLLIILLVIGFGSVAGILLFGSLITNVLLGTKYSAATYGGLGVLSITYKLLYVILYGVILFFTVIRNYTAVYLPLALAILSFGFVSLLPKSSSTVSLLVGLNVIALAGTLISLIILSKNPERKAN
ncbi:MAG: hypothetical protein Q7T41_03035 [Candidatus Saccharibacteria bacterium]|nr:hypothetical protein [Candidatus Saccharibacteria bacterium]